MKLFEFCNIFLENFTPTFGQSAGVATGLLSVLALAHGIDQDMAIEAAIIMIVMTFLGVAVYVYYLVRLFQSSHIPSHKLLWFFLMTAFFPLGQIGYELVGEPARDLSLPRYEAIP